MCRTSLDTITLSDDPEVKFGVPTLGHGLGLKEYNVSCTSREAFQAAQKLLSFSCNTCTESGTPETFKTEDELTRHMVRSHQLFYCDVCTDNQKLFLHEHTLYNRKDLIKHKRSKNTAGVEMHPKCQFCDTRFFDVDALMNHLSQKHEYCSFCEQAGKPSQYFRNYKSIEQHFMNEHFLCMDPICRREKFVAFGTELDYQAHMQKVHGSNGKSDKIDMRLLMDSQGGGGHQGQGNGGFDNHSGFFGDAPAPNFGPPPVDLHSGPSLQAAASMSSRGQGGNGGPAGPPPTAQDALRRALGASAGGTGGQDPSWRGGARGRPPQVDDFPALGGGGGGGGGGGSGYRLAAGGMGGGGRSSIPVHHRSAVVTSSQSDFPTLGGGAPRAASRSAPRAYAKAKTNTNTNTNTNTKPKTVSSHPTVQSKQVNDYPSLGGSRGGADSSRRVPVAAPLAYNAHAAAAASSDADDGWSIAAPSAVRQTAAQPPVRAAPQQPPAPRDFPTLGGRGGGGGVGGGSGGWVGSSKAAEQPRRQPGPLGPFNQPPNFDKRNVALIGMVNSAVDKAQFVDFKTASMAFRRGASTPSQYFDSCATIFGGQMAKIFPELLALLPDVDKQNAVYTVALEAQTSPYKSVDSGVFTLIECEKCGQIVTTDDSKAHLETHPVIVEESFPGLPPSNPRGGSKKKKKKKGGGGASGGQPAGSWGSSSAAIRGADGDYKGVQRTEAPKWGGQNGGGGW